MTNRTIGNKLFSWYTCAEGRSGWQRETRSRLVDMIIHGGRSAEGTLSEGNEIE